MVGDGKAVCLLLNPADQGKYGGDSLNPDLRAVGGDQRAGTVAVVLDHAEDRYGKP